MYENKVLHFLIIIINDLLLIIIIIVGNYFNNQYIYVNTSKLLNKIIRLINIIIYEYNNH